MRSIFCDFDRIPNLFLFRFTGYDLTKDTEFVNILKAIKMIHAIGQLSSIIRFLCR